MKTDQEILMAACRELDFYLIQAEDSMNTWALRHGKDTVRYPWRDCEAEAWRDGPELLTSLDAHFQAGSTVEMLKSDGARIYFGLSLDRQKWDVAIESVLSYLRSTSNQLLPRALTLAFLKWRRPNETWE